MKYLLTALTLLCLAGCSIFMDSNDKLNSQLDDLKARTTKISISQTAKTSRAPVVIEGKELQQFLSVFYLTEPQPHYYCRCIGQLTLLFYDGDEQVATFAYHHDKSFRSSLYRHGNLDIVPEYRVPIKQFFIRQGFSLH